MKIMKTLLCMVSAVALIVSSGCDSSKPKTDSGKSVESVTISTYKGDHSTLLWIAKDRGYFTEHGVNVKIETQESGPASLRDLLAGKVDLAAFSDFVFVSHMLEHPEIRILTVVAQLDNIIRLVARKDHGITGPSDLRDKRIGLVRNTSADYYFHMLLLLQNIPYQNVKVVELSPSEQVKAIMQGDIDAAIVWEPFARQMVTELGNNAISWPAQSGQDFFWTLVGIDDALKKRSSAIRSVMAALCSAEDFANTQRNEAKKIVASQIGASHLPELWETNSFSLGLSRPLILAMESQFRWIKSKEGVRVFKMPDFLNFISFDYLNAVRPERVQMLH
jgi:ABC-type nitrate/sulfonate/bicarbonate transport system substrate-binding protein